MFLFCNERVLQMKMKPLVLFAAMLGAVSAVHAQQVPMGPPVLVYEAQAGDVVCVMSREFGKPSVLTFNLYGSANPAKLIGDISKCADEARGKFKELDKPPAAVQKKT